MIFPAPSDLRAVSVSVSASRVWPNRYDLVVFVVLAAAAVAIFLGARGMGSPLSQLDLAPVSLNPANLPNRTF
jgi:NitT/TauT family transport system permease protein